MGVRITQLEGMTPELAQALRAIGLNNSDKLLAAAAQPQGRAQLADRLGLDERAVLELANRADLARIKGIGRIYSDLLEAAGVDTVVELAQRNPDNLFDKLIEVAARHHVRRLPRRAQVHDWIEQAKQLPRALYH